MFDDDDDEEDNDENDENDGDDEKEGRREEENKILKQKLEKIKNENGSKMMYLLSYLSQLINSKTISNNINNNGDNDNDNNKKNNADSKRMTKVIIFSKFDSLLKQLETLLSNIFKRNNTSSKIFVSCKGNPKMRKKILDHFQSSDPNSPRILLLSLTNAASGTHLPGLYLL